MIAKVALSGVGFGIDKLYDYLIPDRLAAAAAPGQRVSVPFARGNRRQEGMVFALAEESAFPSLKPIDGWLDPAPVLDSGQLKLARWMKTRFFCTYYEAVKAMLPAGVWLRGGAVCRLLQPAEKEAAYAAATEAEARLLDLLYELGGSAPLSAVEAALGADAAAARQGLEEKGFAGQALEGKQRAGDKVTDLAVLAVSAEEALQLAERKKRSAPQQAALLRQLAALGEADLKELRYFTGASAASVKALERAELIVRKQREAFRRPEFTPSDRPPIETLNGAQQQAYDGLRPLLASGEAGAALLYGVTGSGKTAVYIQLIRDALASGRQALVLVPEIALTPQLMRLFYRHFVDRVAVLHSALTMAQRYDEWKRIRQGGADVVVGTRSAVFAPLDRLGLLVVDEEQEASYKSENAPRYHAREVAKYRCVASGALLLLGSATPSVESMHEALAGRYRLFRMDSRYNAQPLPQVLMADMKAELKQGNGGCISALLRRELDDNLAKGEQSILFLNRRGSSSTVSCPECGFTYTCPRCSVRLTFHTANQRVMCHYCGYSQPLDPACPDCGGRLSYTGLGTQRVEEELSGLYGQAAVLRMDTDTVSAAHPHEALLRRFEQERIPILLGTQMVTKGLDFENVTLVGVVSADQMLYAGDFRAQERAFSLITQVVGRAGRGGKRGRAVIQTCTPGSAVLRCAARQDYDGFFADEIEARRLLLAPPIRALYAITVSGTDESLAQRCAAALKAALATSAAALPELRVLGPAPAGVLRVNNRYRYRVLLNAPPSRELRALTAAAIRQFSQDRQYRGLVFFGDADPVE